MLLKFLTQKQSSDSIFNIKCLLLTHGIPWLAAERSDLNSAEKLAEGSKIGLRYSAKRNETKRNKMKRNETKRNETKRNEN